MFGKVRGRASIQDMSDSINVGWKTVIKEIKMEYR